MDPADAQVLDAQYGRDHTGESCAPSRSRPVWPRRRRQYDCVRRPCSSGGTQASEGENAPTRCGALALSKRITRWQGQSWRAISVWRKLVRPDSVLPRWPRVPQRRQIRGRRSLPVALKHRAGLFALRRAIVCYSARAFQCVRIYDAGATSAATQWGRSYRSTRWLGLALLLRFAEVVCVYIHIRTAYEGPADRVVSTAGAGDRISLPDVDAATKGVALVVQLPRSAWSSSAAQMQAKNATYDDACNHASVRLLFRASGG
ncbi:hypothetical protein B0H12DRAFT_326752 [Mycena haematopus]|nr:hypothetical protein B0H12DRAFT_326752 [Mycena haematopus]